MAGCHDPHPAIDNIDDNNIHCDLRNNFAGLLRIKPSAKVSLEHMLSRSEIDIKRKRKEQSGHQLIGGKGYLDHNHQKFTKISLT